jgi:hypothetical protein
MLLKVWSKLLCCSLMQIHHTKFGLILHHCDTISYLKQGHILLIYLSQFFSISCMCHQGVFNIQFTHSEKFLQKFLKILDFFKTSKWDFWKLVRALEKFRMSQNFLKFLKNSRYLLKLLLFQNFWNILKNSWKHSSVIYHKFRVKMKIKTKIISIIQYINPPILHFIMKVDLVK